MISVVKKLDQSFYNSDFVQVFKMHMEKVLLLF